jgi:SnoaL-like domain
VRPAHLIAVLALVAVLAGCDSGSSDEHGTKTDEGRLIRDWLMALNNGDYNHAADFFAPRALVDQGIPYRLRGRAAAKLFNSGLPCRGELVEVEDEGQRVLATFRLRDGPGGSCDGFVKVRFAFRDGRFSEFVQLEQDAPGPAETI